MQKNPNKTFKDLKQKQKAKISEWLYIETLNFWRSNNRIPTKQEFDSILDIVYEKIKSAAIWIPYKEVAAYYQSRLNKYSQRIQRETSENSIHTLNSKQADKTVSKHKNTYRRKKNARKTEKKSTAQRHAAGRYCSGNWICCRTASVAKMRQREFISISIVPSLSPYRYLKPAPKFDWSFSVGCS